MQAVKVRLQPIEHLVGKQIKNHGLTSEQLSFTPDALRTVIRGYTREAGVRNLEREIASLSASVRVLSRPLVAKMRSLITS